MQYLGRFSPVRAVRDLRLFLASRQPHELWFLLAAVAITGFFIYGFAHDSREEVVYRPTIIYVQQWPANRSTAEIRAQQKIDQAGEERRRAEAKAEQDKRRAEFQRLDDSLKRYGL
jgi:hypothetical protein